RDGHVTGVQTCALPIWVVTKPFDKRPALVERFRDDPACRVFLSTDAGSTGLNLQHASILVNMDLPWNPAILEQRIARIHRLGQRSEERRVGKEGRDRWA